MRPRKPVGFALLAAITALVAMALGASTASATEVSPAAKTVEAKLKPGTFSRFIPNNAYNPNAVRCSTATARTTTPEEGAENKNKNRTGVGKFSKGPGSVTMDATEPPMFGGCEVWNEETMTKVANATTATNATNGKWTLSVDRYEAAKEANDIIGVAIGVPKAGATIEIEGTTCVLTVSPEQASAPMGRWTNGAPSTMAIDAQIKFAQTEGCAAFGLASPAQYEAEYEVVRVGEAGTVTINR